MRAFNTKRIASVATALGLAFCSGQAYGDELQSGAVGVLHRRSYFYVGGAYNSTGDAIFSEQMYVEHLVPSNVKQKLPIVIIPGNGELEWSLLFWYLSSGDS